MRDLEDRLPRIIESDWRGPLPLWKAGGDERPPGYQTIGQPPRAVIWYSQDDDAVMVTHNGVTHGALRDRLDGAIAALRLEVARW